LIVTIETVLKMNRCIRRDTVIQKTIKWSHISETFDSEQPEDWDNIQWRAPKIMSVRLGAITCSPNIEPIGTTLQKSEHWPMP
jgi:hypothetical protein